METVKKEKNAFVSVSEYYNSLSTQDKNSLLYYLANKYGKSLGTWQNKLLGYHEMNACERECIENTIKNQLWK